MSPLPLREDRQLEVMGLLGVTRISIENREARITESPCANKICVGFGRVSRSGQMAVCLPNRVVIRVASREVGRDLDAVSR